MPSHAIKIGKFYHAQNGTQESFELSYAPEEFEGIPLKGEITIDADLIRVEEGVMLVLKDLKAIQKTLCSSCGKALELSYKMKPSEWLFYENKPLEYDDENEFLFFDKHKMELDPTEPLRQELILNQEVLPRCLKGCKKFKEVKEEGPKALAGLKNLLK